MNRYYNPVRAYQGYGCLAELPRLAQEAAAPGKRTLLLVWDESVLAKQGIRELLEKDKTLLVRRFGASNPELGQLYHMYQETRALEVGLVIAVGGGSVLDVGKSLCCLYGSAISSEEELRQLIAEKRYGAPACRWIGVPTTAGTGSEVTCWATIWDSCNDVKFSVDTSENYAFAALADPQLADTMPLGLAVSSALDAVAHATESYWAKATNTVSRALALKAIRTVMGHIDLLLKDPASREAHDQMAKGSMLAGLAFSNTRTTGCHSISYPLTMRRHIPHGVAVSLLLGPVLALNYPAVQDGQALLEAFGVQRPADVQRRVADILLAAGHPVTLRAWGVAEEDIPLLAAHGITKGRADNNPVELTEMVVQDILHAIL
ncbi:MAG: phosphonoacetaldehyde reductase [Gemmiger sp.]|nr:phosphonoacetaldehyde reductase [Gemmiger sp.]